MFLHRNPQLMSSYETTVRMPHSADDPRCSVSIPTEGVELVIYFEDPSGAGEVLEVQIKPAALAITPAVMSHIGRNFVTFVDYARASVQWRREDVAEAVRALRGLGKTKRGVPDELLRTIARQYDSLRAEGDPHPNKTLAQMHWVAPSTSSRWVKEARRRGYLATEPAT
jgi:hypothetical protein